ncbi:unnamed protein product [Choristocarpus tenellus]
MMLRCRPVGAGLTCQAKTLAHLRESVVRCPVYRMCLTSQDKSRAEPLQTCSCYRQNGDKASTVVQDARLKGISEAVGDSNSLRRHRHFNIDGRGEFLTQNIIVDDDKDQGHNHQFSFFMSGVESLLAHVLPRGFPESVHHQYRTYSQYQFIAMTASAAGGVLSTQALLYAMGVGAGALPLAATLNWVIKDGLGQLGGVIFSSLVNTRFDANPKLWCGPVSVCVCLNQPIPVQWWELFACALLQTLLENDVLVEVFCFCAVNLSSFNLWGRPLWV